MLLRHECHKLSVEMLSPHHTKGELLTREEYKKSSAKETSNLIRNHLVLVWLWSSIKRTHDKTSRRADKRKFFGIFPFFHVECKGELVETMMMEAFDSQFFVFFVLLLTTKERSSFMPTMTANEKTTYNGSDVDNLFSVVFYLQTFLPL